MELFGRSILGYFVHREQAERAKADLRRAGFDTVQVDRIDPGHAGADTLYNPLTGRFDGLAELTGAAGDMGGGPLAAADPDASGLAHTTANRGEAERPHWIVTVVTTEDQVNRAVQILEDAGGLV
ncbi:MAG: hypothetical protein BAA04_08380 [Firmicutes bacterium ZCTH02-B6]|nr:MAG: hypothetical protein BAA04_08380 [Firmicutes bacterium ZCTH02-B6]